MYCCFAFSATTCTVKICLGGGRTQSRKQELVPAPESQGQPARGPVCVCAWSHRIAYSICPALASGCLPSPAISPHPQPWPAVTSTDPTPHVTPDRQMVTMLPEPARVPGYLPSTHTRARAPTHTHTNTHTQTHTNVVTHLQIGYLFLHSKLRGR